jgi:hypothetical protein
MRSYLQNKRRFSIQDLKRIYADARRNARKALTSEAYRRNLLEAQAVGYVLYVVERGKAPYRGRPSARVKFFMSAVKFEKNPPFSPTNACGRRRKF